MFDTEQLLTELRTTRAEVGTNLKGRIDAIEKRVNELFVRANRPGADSYGDDRDMERKSAIAMCEDRRSWTTQKSEGRRIDYTPGGDEIAEALGAHRAFRAIIRHGDFQRLDHEMQKNLTAFAFSNQGWAMPPQVSSHILSCLTDQTDFLGLLSQETISAATIQFPLDNSQFEGIGWACETSLEIKPETLRARLCATVDLLEDASFNVEGWLQTKASRAIRQKLAAAFICGSGVGQPVGILL